MENKDNKISKIFFVLIVLFFIFFGLTFAIISFIPIANLKELFGFFAKDGVADVFKESILLRAKIFGFFYIILGIIFIITRKKIINYFCNIREDFNYFKKDLKKYSFILFKEEKIHIFFLIVITLIGISIRFYFINQPVRHDEAITFMSFIRAPLYKSLSDYSSSNNHILHTFFSHFFYLIFGNKLWAIRITTFIFGTLLIPTTYFTGRYFYNKNTAILSASLMAASSPFIEYSTNARGYTLLCFLFLLTLIISKYVLNSNNKFGWLLFAIFSSLGFFTIPTFLYSFGVTVIWLFLSIIFKEKNIKLDLTLLKNLLIGIINTILFTIVLYSPSLILTTSESGIVKNAIEPHSLPYFFKTLPGWLLKIWQQWNRDIPVVLIIIILIGFFISIIFNKIIKGPKINLFFAVLLSCIPLIIIQRPTMYERIWLFLIPIYFIIASSGIVFILEFGIKRIKKISLYIIPVISLILVIFLNSIAIQSKSVIVSNGEGTLLDAEKITLYLKNELRPNDRILLQCPSEWPMYYYFDKYNISSNFFNSDINKSTRIFIIVNNLNNQTIESITDYEKVNIDGFAKPQMLRKFEYADLLYSKRDLNLFVSSIFKNFLGRNPDKDELNIWANKLSSKEITVMDFIKTITSSDEYNVRNISDSDYIKILYNSLLNREPDEQGYNGWINILKHGKSREYVLSGFINSKEFQDFCKLYDVLSGGNGS